MDASTGKDRPRDRRDERRDSGDDKAKREWAVGRIMDILRKKK